MDVFTKTIVYFKYYAIYNASINNGGWWANTPLILVDKLDFKLKRNELSHNHCNILRNKMINWIIYAIVNILDLEALQIPHRDGNCSILYEKQQ